MHIKRPAVKIYFLMDLSISVNLFSTSFFAAIVFTGFLRTLSKKYNLLIDLPDRNRKFHDRPTPLVGGLGIHLAMLFGLFLLFISVDSKIYDSDNNLLTLNSNIEITDKGNNANFEVSATKKQLKLTESLEAYEVMVDGVSYPLNIIQNSEGNFEVSLPGKKTKTFSYKNGTLIDLEENDSFDVSRPEEKVYFPLNITMFSIVLMAVFLQIMMIFNDAYGFNQLQRLFIQSLASIGVIAISGQYITSIGFELFGWDGNLGIFGTVFTVFAVTGIINAFNMIDGINGLCSGISLIIFLSLSIISLDSAISYGSLIIIGSLVGFLVYNLGLFGKKRAVFLGDNGSNFLGFIVAWSCINYSSNNDSLINPVAALWLVAIPLWDCVSLIIKRSIDGSNAFLGDRNHIHHVLLDNKLSGNKALIILLVACFIFACIGLQLDKILDPRYSLLIFLLFGILFYLLKNMLILRAYSQR
jgi:UDP-GlcNAc:undecaprenyl-phosphate GlcNAc-1-phosphate transferase